MRNCFPHGIQRKKRKFILELTNLQRGKLRKKKEKKIADGYFEISAFYCRMWYDSRSGIGHPVNYRVQASGYQCIHVKVKERIKGGVGINIVQRGKERKRSTVCICKWGEILQDLYRLSLTSLRSIQYYRKSSYNRSVLVLETHQNLGLVAS